MATDDAQYWLDKEKVNRELDRTGFYYERCPYDQVEYGLTWILADEVKRASTASGKEPRT